MLQARCWQESYLSPSPDVPPTAGSPAVPAAAASPAAASSSSPPAAAGDAAAPAGTTTVITQPPGDPLLVQLPAPTTIDETVAQLRTRTDQVGELIRRGDFTAVYVPAFQARDLAIALEARLNDLPPARRAAAEPAISRLVRTAWLLDAFGDLGNRQQITDAYAVFTAAVTEVIDSFK